MQDQIKEKSHVWDTKYPIRLSEIFFDMNSRVDRLTILTGGQINDYRPRLCGVTEFGL